MGDIIPFPIHLYTERFNVLAILTNEGCVYVFHVMCMCD